MPANRQRTIGCRFHNGFRLPTTSRNRGSLKTHPTQFSGCP
ncbi:MAG: hypothetical protein ACFNNL_09355 [Kingella oralis]